MSNEIPSGAAKGGTDEDDDAAEASEPVAKGANNAATRALSLGTCFFSFASDSATSPVGSSSLRKEMTDF